MFSSDNPIKNETEDKLNRMPFVNQLSKSICSYDSENCLVIGLMGEWGTGKTSIINLTYNEMKKEKNNWIYIKFDPWYFSNQDDLILHFFDEIMNELKSSDMVNNVHKKLCNGLESFIKGLTINLNLGVIGASVDGEKILEKPEYKEFLDVKKDLKTLFEDLDYKIIISIDNIDRLTDEEIKQIFLLTKSLADFPNVIYILSFDYDVVVSSINSLQNYSGEDYLEKIIQIPIVVPKVTETKLDDLIYTRLTQTFENNSEIWNQYFNGLNNLFWKIKPFIKTIRDLNRYVNILNFHINSFIEEINIGNYILLLVLEVFEPKIYLKIKNYKKILTRYYEIQELSREEQKKTNDQSF